MIKPSFVKISLAKQNA